MSSPAYGRRVLRMSSRSTPSSPSVTSTTVARARYGSLPRARPMASNADTSAKEMSVCPSAGEARNNLWICWAASSPVSTRSRSSGVSLKKVKYSGSKASPAVAFTRIALSSEISSASRKRARAPCIEPEASNT